MGIIVDAFAVIVSIWSLIKSTITSRKQKQIKLRENYYEPVFKEIMTKKYPKIFTDFVNIKTNQICVEKSTDFENLIGEFRKNIKYLIFTNSDIYEKLEKVLIDIDEKIVILCTKDENRKENIEIITELSKSLYSIVDNYFSMS